MSTKKIIRSDKSRLDTFLVVADEASRGLLLRTLLFELIGSYVISIGLATISSAIGISSLAHTRYQQANS